MSSFETGDESLSLEAFAESVIADLGGDGADTATAPAESTDTSPTDGTDTAEAPGLKEDATGRLHGEDGKFVEKPKDGDDEETETETDEPEEGDDPEFVLEVDDEETAAVIGEYLEKYDGDVVKALKAATEAQSLIGRKGTEASQSAAEAAALREELRQSRELQQKILARMSQPQVPLIPITQELIEEDPHLAARQAVLQDNAAALEATIAVWREENPDAANFFLQNLVLEAQLAERQQAAPQTAESSTDDEVDSEVAKVLAKHPDLEKHLPAIGKAADANPLLKRALEHGSPVEKAQALEALTVIAKAGTTADTSREAMKRVQIRVKQEADEARRSAAVVSASRSSAASTSQPTRVDDFLSAFDERLGLKVNET